MFSSIVSAKILGSIEKRWKKADQDIMILCVLLNPSLGRGQCFNRAALTPAAIKSIAKKTFKRLFQHDSNMEFTSALVDYMGNRAEFADDAMGWEEAAAHARAEKKVCPTGGALDVPII